MVIQKKGIKMKGHHFYQEVPMLLRNFMLIGLLNYREAYNMFACNGILFNHESPIRGETFVTKKIVKSAVKISKGDKIVYI